MGRSGFTDEGGASMMDWLRDSVDSSNISVEKSLCRIGWYEDLDLLLEQEDAENNDLMMKISTLESLMSKEKLANKKLFDQLEQDETELAFQDQVIHECESKMEELECQIAEGKKLIEELKAELEESNKKNAEVRDYAVASVSVAITLGAVLFSIFSKMQ